ncbi:MAG TPA: MlaD family protein, partial [Thermoleophilaceae bacterium]
MAGALLVLAAVALALGAKGGDAADKRTYLIEFDNAFGLTDGGDFKIAGVRAGETTDFRLVGQARPRAVVTAQITEPGFAALRADARCEIRPQSLIGEYYVDCQPGTSSRRLPDGATVPVARTSSTIPVDLVGNIMRRPYRERLRLIVEELGAG